MNNFPKLAQLLKIKGFSRKTIKSYTYHNSKFLKFVKKSPREVSGQDIKRYLEYLADKGYTSASLNLVHNALKFYYAQIYKRRFFLNIPRAKKEKKLPVVLSKNEVKRILGALSNPKHKLILSLMYASGLRVSEVVRLKVKDLDFDNEVLIVHGGKGKKDRQTLLPENLIGELETLVRDKNANDYVFESNRGGRLTERSVQKMFLNALKKSKIKKKATCHSLRHSFATYLLGKGVNIHYIQELLGHKRLETTQIYTKVAGSKLKEVGSPLDDLRQSLRWAKYMNALGWEVKKINNCQIFIKGLPLGLGSLVKILRPTPPIPFEEIDKIAKKYKAWFVKLEPNVIISNSQPASPAGGFPISNFQKHGFSPSPWPLSPTKTIQINLAKSKRTLWADLKKEARNVIRKAIKNIVTVTQSEDIEQFCTLWVKNMRKRGNFRADGREIKALWKVFKEGSCLLLAHRKIKSGKPGSGKLLAGALILTRGQVAHYMHAASNREGNKLGAPSLVVWETILLAKKLGCQVLDLEGIYDPRYSKAQKGWRGFSYFKKGFGGEEVDYLGSFIKCYNRFLSPFLIFNF